MQRGATKQAEDDAIASASSAGDVTSSRDKEDAASNSSREAKLVQLQVSSWMGD